MPFVSITRLRVRSWRYLPPFFFHTLLAARQARSTAGHLHLSLLRDRHNTYWTRTVWASEQSMKCFMLEGAHRRVMPRLREWCDEAALVHWTQDSAEPPTWTEAHTKLLQLGRPSTVNRPTAAHQLHQIPPPAIGRG